MGWSSGELERFRRILRNRLKPLPYLRVSSDLGELIHMAVVRGKTIDEIIS
jgi:hypothetical protein